MAPGKPCVSWVWVQSPASLGWKQCATAQWHLSPADISALQLQTRVIFQYQWPSKAKLKNKMNHRSCVLSPHAPSYNNAMFSAQINLSFAPSYYFTFLSAEAERGLKNELSATVTWDFHFCSRNPSSYQSGLCIPMPFLQQPGYQDHSVSTISSEGLQRLSNRAPSPWGESWPVGAEGLIYELLRSEAPAQLPQPDLLLCVLHCTWSSSQPPLPFEGITWGDTGSWLHLLGADGALWKWPSDGAQKNTQGKLVLAPWEAAIHVLAQHMRVTTEPGICSFQWAEHEGKEHKGKEAIDPFQGAGCKQSEPKSRSHGSSWMPLVEKKRQFEPYLTSSCQNKYHLHSPFSILAPF